MIDTRPFGEIETQNGPDEFRNDYDDHDEHDARTC
jgi:hypothetical protein